MSDSLSKGLEVESCLACSRNRKKASVSVCVCVATSKINFQNCPRAKMLRKKINN